MDINSSLPWVLINLVFAALALGLGFVAGAFFCGARRQRDPSADASAQGGSLEKRVALERALLATGQLHDIATGVAADVGDHSRCVEQISADLSEAKDARGVIDQTIVTSALTKIVSANEVLQKKLEKAEKQIKAQASEIALHESEARTDSLTGLANRRAFDDELSRRIAEHNRKSTPLCLVLLDVDHFKRFNDTHGHQAGDEVLRQVAESMRDTTRAMDIPCRYGGEEFAVVLPSTSLEDAMALAERVRAGIEQLTITHDGKDLTVTASVGVAQIHPAEDAQRLLRRADEALYEAKDAGRNRGYVQLGQHCEPIKQRMTRARQAESADANATGMLLDRLPNRTLFVGLLGQRVAEAQRLATPLAVLIVGVGGASDMNRKHGEPAARRMLDAVAQFLEGSIREMDTVGYIDADRFAVLLPNASAKDAEIIARRAGSALTSCVVPVGGGSVTLDAKITFTSIQPLDTSTTLLKRAEDALASTAVIDEPLLV